MPNMPDYDAIAATLHRQNNAPAAIARALREAYRRGATDGLAEDDVAALVKHRVGRHVESLDRLSRDLGRLTDEIRRLDPADVTARTNGGLRRG